jgi:oxaloacetate decarboxylase beta subunit/glutaconyl-CoA decarboxylase
LYMAIVKEFEPLLLGPIAFGCILANFPRTGFFHGTGTYAGHSLWYCQ